MDLELVKEELLSGKPILVFDFEDREGETDIVFYAEKVTYERVRFMRKHGGGLICVPLGPEIWKTLGIPYLVQIFDVAKDKFKILEGLWPNDIPYDESSSFAITVNHRRTFTGISDKDRALTISELGKLGKKCKELGEKAREVFGRDFRSPGHVFLLNAHRDLLDRRRGHTELTIGIARMCGLTEVMAIVEMLGDDGRSLPKDLAKEFAENHNLIFVEGREVLKAWEEWKRRK